MLGLALAMLVSPMAVGFAAATPVAEPETIPGTRMRVDWQGLVSEHNLELPRLPDNFNDSLRIGNGDIGVAVYAVPECLILSVAKNDLLDYRCFEPGNFSLPPTSKPAGAIRFRSAKPRNPVCKVRHNIWDGEINVCSEHAPSPEIRTFVSKKRNLIVTEYQPTSGQDFDVEIARNKDNSTSQIPYPPELGAGGRDFWVRYKFPPDPNTYPDGFEYVMYGRVIGGQFVSSDVVNDFITQPNPNWGAGTLPEAIKSMARVHMKSSSAVTVLVAVVTTRDSKTPMQAAKAEVDAAQRAGLSNLRQEHAELWHEFWRKSFVQLTGRDFVNQQWFLSQYHLACITRPGSVAPGMFGPWIWEDFPGWGNDNHWDYNMQSTIWGAFSSNHHELTEAYHQAAFDLLPAAKLGTAEYGNFPGAKYPVLSWPRNYTQIAVSRKYGGPFVNGFVAQPLWWYYQYSQDKTFLREKGYPVIKACAEFYEHFVQRAPDGKYDMPPTEVWDLVSQSVGKIADSRNSTIDLAFAKMLFRMASAASKVLGVDADKCGVWDNIANNLRDYPTAVIDGKDFKPVDRRAAGAMPLYTSRSFPSGKVLVAYENYPVVEYNVPPWTMPIFPGGDIGLHSLPKEQELALRTLEITPYYLWDDLVMLSMAWIRLGHDQLDVAEKHARSLVRTNGMQSYPRDCWPARFGIFTHLLGWPIVVNESLVQSYTGQIRVSPVKLKNAARFARLRAEGAFLLSGEIQSGGKVSYLAITSEVGRPCNLVRPWDGPVRVRRLDSMAEVTVAEKDGVLTFPTTAGATYVLDRPDAPWESQPVTDIAQTSK